MTESFFVPADDGYTLPGRIPRAPGLYPEARFKYRPATPETRAAYADAAGPGRVDVAAGVVSRGVVELKAVGPEGLEMPGVRVAPEQCKRMHAELFQRLLMHVLGYEGPCLEELEKNSAPASD